MWQAPGSGFQETYFGSWWFSLHSNKSMSVVPIIAIILQNIAKLFGAFVCINIEGTRQMACKQPDIIFHVAHPNTFRKFVAKGRSSAPPPPFVVGQFVTVYM